MEAKQTVMKKEVKRRPGGPWKVSEAPTQQASASTMEASKNKEGRCSSSSQPAILVMLQHKQHIANIMVDSKNREGSSSSSSHLSEAPTQATASNMVASKNRSSRFAHTKHTDFLID